MSRLDGKVAVLTGAGSGIALGDVPVAGLVALLNNVARGLGMEHAIGMTAGHDDAAALIERYLDTVEPPPAASD